MAMLNPNAPMPDFESQQAALDEQRRMVELMRKRPTAQPGMRMVSGIAVAPHWAERLAPVLDEVMAARAADKLRKGTADLGVQQEAAANSWRAGMPTARPAIPGQMAADGMGPPTEDQPAQPVTREAILKHTMAGLQNPRTAKESMLLNQSLTSELTRKEDEVFKNEQARALGVEKNEQARAAAQEKLVVAKEKIEGEARELTLRLDDKALSREQQKAYQDSLLKLQDQWKINDDATKRFLGGLASQTRLAVAGMGGNKPDELKRLPSAQSKAWIENQTSLSKLDRADAAILAYPKAFGASRIAPEWMNNRLDPDGVTGRATVADLASLKIHQRSGAAVTAAETPRLMPFIPRAWDEPAVITKKIQQFRDEYLNIQNEIADYADNQKYINPRKTAPTIEDKPSAGGTTERIIGGKKYINKGGGPSDWHESK